jgi:hypothetical protein
VCSDRLQGGKYIASAQDCQGSAPIPNSAEPPGCRLSPFSNFVIACIGNRHPNGLAIDAKGVAIVADLLIEGWSWKEWVAATDEQGKQGE